MSETHINIYDRSQLLAVVSGSPAEAWREARTVVRALARDAGDARRSTDLEWCRPRGRCSYERAGFRAVNTFRQEGAAR